MKIQSIIDQIKSETDCNNRISPKTIDQIIIGDADQEVTGIITTFMATVEVIQKAIHTHANLIITHEPTWFNGHDRVDSLENDLVYQKKLDLIQKAHIVIWRFHDHMHFGGTHDMIVSGFAKQLGWEDYLLTGQKNGHNVLEKSETRFIIPTHKLTQVLNHLSNRLNLKNIRYIGSDDQPIKNIAALVGGASLGLGDERNPMMQMIDQNIDLVICGDITEWTLSAYIRDANRLGIMRSMAVIGHERSEEFGMKYVSAWIQNLTGENVQWIDAGEPFSYFNGSH